MQKTRLRSMRMASFALAICISAPLAAQQQDNDNKAMVNMTIQIQQLQDEVRTLRGMLEDQGEEIENLGNRQRDQFLDLDQRINDLRGGASGGPAMAASGGVAPVAAQPAGTGQAATQGAQPRANDTPDVSKPVNAKPAVTGLPTPDTASHTTAPTPETEKAAYDKAFQSLKELKYADAAEQFKAFLKQYPDSEFADNAQYWLGESYYVTRNYDIALEAFQNLLTKFPQSPKVPDSLLKIGYTYYELKQWDQARAALEQVKQQYPDTTLARLAESRLRSMKLEGHY